jgi:4-amino-4-deoxy-L-arabinose transferase-like glycosyltransferase
LVFTSIARRPEWLGGALITCAFLLIVFAIGPAHNFPIEDDWDYSKTVWNFLQTGVFRRLEVTQATVVFPALWGTLFSKILGFSFTTLRLSVLVLAFGTLVFFYALLGELEFDPPRRVVASLALMVTPAFVYLAFSFMTDVPFLFGLAGALYFYVRAWRRDNLRLAVIASAFAALAFLARQAGVFIPLAFGAFVLLYAHGRNRPTILRWLLAGTAVPLIAVGLYLMWEQFLGGANWADRTRTLSGTLGFWLHWNTPGVMGRRAVIAAATIGIYILPLWFAVARAVPDAGRGWAASARWQKASIGVLAGVFVIALARLALRNEWFPYLADILTRRGLRPYLAYFAYEMGAHRPFVFSLEVSAALTASAGILGWILSALIVGRLKKRVPPELALIYLTTLILVAASLSFFTYFERYLLPLMPGAIVLLLDVTRRARFSVRAGLAGLLVVAVFSTMLMRDYFAWNQVKWGAGRELLAAGVPVEKIDGGYEWDGWYLYDESVAHIRAQGLEMTIDPWKYILDPEFIFAFQPPPGYRVVEVLNFVTPLRPSGTDKIFLLRREWQSPR